MTGAPEATQDLGPPEWLDLGAEAGLWLMPANGGDLYVEDRAGGRRRFLCALPPNGAVAGLALPADWAGPRLVVRTTGAASLIEPDDTAAWAAGMAQWVGLWLPPLVPPAPGWPQIAAAQPCSLAAGQVLRVPSGQSGALVISAGTARLWGKWQVGPGHYPAGPGLWLAAGTEGCTVALAPFQGGASEESGRAQVSRALLSVLAERSETDAAYWQATTQRIAAENSRQLASATQRLFDPSVTAREPLHGAAMSDLSVPERTVLDALARLHRLEAAPWGAAEAERAQRVPVERGYAAAPERVMRMLKVLGTGARTVRLDAGFWAAPGPPLMAWRGADGGIGVLDWQDGAWHFQAASVRVRVSRAERADFQPEALQIYPWDRSPTWGLGALARNAMRASGAERLRLALSAVMVAFSAMALPFLLHALIDTALPQGDRPLLALIIAGLVVMAISQAAFDLILQLVSARLAARLELRLQPALVQRLLRLPLRFFRSQPSGEILDRALALNAAPQILGASAAGFVIALLAGMAALVPMVVFDPMLALVGLGFILIGALAQAALSVPVQQRNRTAYDVQGRVEGIVLQLFRGIAKLRVAAAEPRAMTLWAEGYAAVRAARLSADRWRAIQAATSEALGLLAYLALMLATAWQSDLLGQPPGSAPIASAISPAEFIAFAAAFGQVAAAGRAAAQALASVAKGLALARRARPLLATPLEHPSDYLMPPRLSGAIELRGLVFRHLPDTPPLLQGINLHIAPGTKVAIVGPSGSGKSTLLRLILGLETAEAGEVLYDGLPLDRIDPASLRAQVGAVLQDGRISAGTLLDNISGDRVMGIHDAWDAARRVGLDRDIEAMPMGMHTLLQDGGSALSGGQRQRLLLARAIAGTPAIMVLDEATSALDNTVQARVMETLRQMSVTRIVVAHRLSTIRDADVIHVLSGGRIVQSGSFADLSQADGPFRQMIRRQSL